MHNASRIPDSIEPRKVLPFDRFCASRSRNWRGYNPHMDKIAFGSTGLMVSRLGYGSANIAYLHTDPKQSADMIRRLLDAGINVLDTAASYPGSEKFIGEHLSDRRSDYVLVSKLGQGIPESEAPAWSEKLVLDTIDRALRSLQTDRIDVMLLHSCDLETLKKGDAL